MRFYILTAVLQTICVLVCLIDW